MQQGQRDILGLRPRAEPVHDGLAVDALITWSQALCFTGELASCEPATFRYRVCSIAGRLTHSSQNWHLQLDLDWPSANDLAQAFDRLRAAPWPA